MLELLQIAKVLVSKGHKVAFLLEDWDLEELRAKDMVPPSSGVSFIVTRPFADPAAGRADLDALLETQNESLDAMGAYIEHQGRLCRRLLRNADTLAAVRDFKPDLAVTDALYPCATILADVLSIPRVEFSPTTLSEPVHALQLGYVASPATVPAYGSALAAPHTFGERFANWIAHLIVEKVVLPKFHTLEAALRAEFGAPQRKEAAPPRLFLFNANFALDSPRQLPEGVIPVGPLLAAPARPLTGALADLETEALKAQKPFVYVSFGSMFKMTNATEVRTLAAALNALDRPVLWQTSAGGLPRGLAIADLDLGPHVRVVPWAPQNDVLGSPALGLFISHGGTNSVYEAAYHGASMVNVPFMGDHRDHAVKAAARGFSVTVDRATLAAGNPTSLVEAANKVLGDPGFRRAAEKVGALLRAHPKTAAERAAEWIEAALAMPPGTGLPVSDPAAALPWWIRDSHDVHAVVAVVGGGAVWLAMRVIRRARRLVVGRRKRKVA